MFFTKQYLYLIGYDYRLWVLLFYKTSVTIKPNKYLHTLHRGEGIHNNSIYISSNPSNKVRFIVLATSAKILTLYLLPMLFILKMVKFFLMYFRYLTLRSTYVLGQEMRHITKKKNTCTLLGPLKPFKVPINLLIRFRIPFVFVGYTTSKNWALIKYRYLNLVFGFYKIQRMGRVWALLQDRYPNYV